ncbi:MBL fold metallo-hydrolase [Acutalibacter sp. 1XD8-33]|uniref:MBL fold metallo-hydrolase n=1 Tax=Acutalibacter sp. 1XD8-33 TaxID=2320081 RepID=UPI000EA2ACDC|nr:MBL fold metallo-hydrolase [Acutalibacter sp. 1XD8-33]RKJ39428.1 MBL fold metallo-hydrolase [Acutalibacter sp. 1XD8-33]
MENWKKAGKNQELSWVWQGEKAEEKQPLALCLAESEAAAERRLEQMAEGETGAILAAVVLPEGSMDAWEEDLGDLIFAWKNCEQVEETRISLTGTAACGDAVWRLGAHFPQWFSAVCVVGGHADPYEARQLSQVPLRAYALAGQDCQVRAGKVYADVERTVMGIRVVGGENISCLDVPEGLDGQAAWDWAFAGGETVKWLVEQDRKRQFQVYNLQPGVWRIDDFFTSTCYLIEGKEKALLVDTGMGQGDLPGLVRRLTRLPVEVAVTHPHGDHMHKAERFSKIYLHKNDIARLREHPEKFPAAFSQGSQWPELVPIEEGTKIDLGGGVVVETLELGGHTPDSVVFADDFHKLLCTGDAIGSGYIALMICPEDQMLPYIETYRDNLERFAKHLPRLKDYAWLGGHVLQENGCDMRHQPDFNGRKSAYFNPIRPRVVEDMLTLCQKILSGEISKEEIMAAKEHYCSHGSAGMYFAFRP